MTRVFNKFGRIAAVAILTGVMVPNASLAGNHGGHHSSGNAMKSGGNQFHATQFKSIGNAKSNSNNFRRLNTSSLQSANNWTNSVKLETGKFNSNVLKTSNLSKNLGTGKLGQFKQLSSDVIKLKDRGKINFPGGPLVTGGSGKFKFPGGPIVGPFNPGNVGPLPGGKPIDPGQGNGNPGGGNDGGTGNGHNHCHHNCPWPVFWPLYGGGNYWNSPYYGPSYATPTAIVNDVVPVSTQTPAQVDVSVASKPDLVLEDVQYVEPATLLVGPAYRVKFRNQGMVAAGKFRLALIASIDGQAYEQSPQTMVEVAGLASGESGEVTVRLPHTAMQLANSTGQSTAFTDLLVAADIDNLVIESDKTNNVAIISRSQLEVPSK